MNPQPPAINQSAGQLMTSPKAIAEQIFSDQNLLEQVNRLAPKTCRPDRLLRLALQCIISTPKLQECMMTPVGKSSVIAAFLKSSQFGLEFDGRQAHMVPFKKGEHMIATFVAGYQGLIDLAYNHPKVSSIWWKVVYERDEFHYTEGLNRELVHRPYTGEDDPGPIICAYAVAQLTGGALSFVVLNRRDLNRIRSSSSSYRYAESTQKRDSLWHTAEPQMAGKSAVRQLSKQIPQCSELRDLLSEDDEADTEDVQVSAPSFTPRAPVIDVAPRQAIQEQTRAQQAPVVDRGRDSVPMDNFESATPAVPGTLASPSPQAAPLKARGPRAPRPTQEAPAPTSPPQPAQSPPPAQVSTAPATPPTVAPTQTPPSTLTPEPPRRQDPAPSGPPRNGETPRPGETANECIVRLLAEQGIPEDRFLAYLKPKMLAKASTTNIRELDAARSSIILKSWHLQIQNLKG